MSSGSPDMSRDFLKAMLFGIGAEMAIDTYPNNMMTVLDLAECIVAVRCSNEKVKDD
jgi:hypothetical protein